MQADNECQVKHSPHMDPLKKLSFKADPILTCRPHSPRAGSQVYALTVESHLADVHW